jgi:hypothetical protein
MNARLQRQIEDPQAREAMAIVALRRDALVTLQQLADVDAPLGRRIARRLIDAGHEVQVVRGALRHSPETRPRELISGWGNHALLHNGPEWPRIMVAPLRVVLVWDTQRAWLFACDCAERVLRLFERHMPGDDRAREAIAAGRLASRGYTDAAAKRLRSARRGVKRAEGEALNSRRPGSFRAGYAATSACGATRTSWRGSAVASSWALRALREAPREHAAEVAWQRARFMQYLLDEVPDV